MMTSAKSKGKMILSGFIADNPLIGTLVEKFDLEIVDA
jgi:hypothetical protein